jgi:hypothetical protein
MKIGYKRWYSVTLLLVALLINENTVQWALAVKIGGYSISGGFREAFKYFSIVGYLFFTAFRIVPYAGLAFLLFMLSKTKSKDYVLPVFIGGLLGILALLLWGFWTAQLPYYTGEHVSSTTAIAFVFIPIYACLSGGVGVLVSAAIYTPFRFLVKRMKAKGQ